MTTPKIYWQPHPGPQTKALMSVCRETLFGGAKGGGKTDAGLAWLLYDIDNPLLRMLVIRHNAEDLSDWVDRARLFYKSSGANIVGKPARIQWPSGALARIGHMKDEKSYLKYMGHEYQRILIEELTEMPRLEDYLKLIASCRSTVPGLEARVFMTTNPGGPGHGWVKERFIDVASPSEIYIDPITGRTRIFIPAKVTDNPTLMKHDPSYIDFLNSLPEPTRSMWRDGSWDHVEGQFFSKFVKQIHVVEPKKLPDEWGKAVGIDWGYSPHPCSVSWWARDFENQVYKYRELLMWESSPKTVACKILELSKDDKNIDTWVGGTDMWIRNPYSGGVQETFKAFSDKSIASTFMNNGIPLLQANNDRFNGWQLMKTLMEWEGDFKDGEYHLTKYPMLHYFSTCFLTIKTMPMQQHDPIKPGDMIKKKGNTGTSPETYKGDDCCESDRYCLMHLLEGIEIDSEKTPMEKFLEAEKKSYGKGVIMAEEDGSRDWMDS